MKCLLIAALSLTTLLAPKLQALCIYKGKTDAKTTVSQEFQDSRWVVRAKLIAFDDHWSDEDDSWTIYHLQVLTAYKGKPPLRIDLFTYRDSGGFFLDNLGDEHLLFLGPLDLRLKVPAAARAATEVNYNCGESKAWKRVQQPEQDRLASLAHGRQTLYRAPPPTDERTGRKLILRSDKGLSTLPAPPL